MKLLLKENVRNKANRRYCLFISEVS